ncbi:unnamed protein product [Rhizophagus irregularis]|nr:unnamed protein product [Rhizophagus irregularis]
MPMDIPFGLASHAKCQNNTQQNMQHKAGQKDTLIAIAFKSGLAILSQDQGRRILLINHLTITSCEAPPSEII